MSGKLKWEVNKKRQEFYKKFHNNRGTMPDEKYKVPYRSKKKKDLSVLIKMLGGVPRC